jgi:hypothetical protein
MLAGSLISVIPVIAIVVCRGAQGSLVVVAVADITSGALSIASRTMLIAIGSGGGWGHQTLRGNACVGPGSKPAHQEKPAGGEQHEYYGQGKLHG